jgi:tetratricopeptide (TPR) repeat protein
MKNQDALQSCLSNQATVLIHTGQLAEAMPKLEEQEKISLQIGSSLGLQSSYGNQALIFQALESYEIALSLFRNQERICRDIKNPYHLGISLANQALLLADKLDKPKQALGLAEEAQSLAKAYGLQDLLVQFTDILEYVRSRISDF